MKAVLYLQIFDNFHYTIFDGLTIGDILRQIKSILNDVNDVNKNKEYLIILEIFDDNNHVLLFKNSLTGENINESSLDDFVNNPIFDINPLYTDFLIEMLTVDLPFDTIISDNLRTKYLRNISN